MVSETILLLGANGQVGNALRQTLLQPGAVIALDFPEIDFKRPDLLRDVVRRIHPDIIVNAAAYTAVDKAESEAELAFAVNATAPRVLAEEADTLGAILVHYSTDYVFDGMKNDAYVESDTPAPLSIYGHSKLEGDLAVEACSRHLIFRTSWVISGHGQNFIRTMLRLAGERDTLCVVADQIGVPTSAALLARITTEVLARRKPEDETRWGVYNLVAAGETSWYGLARHVIARAAAKGFFLKLRPNAVVPISTAEYPTTAVRPQNSRLDTTKIRSTFGVTLPDWTVGVDDAVSQLVDEFLQVQK